VDPHLYKATPRDVRKLNRAQVVIYNGLHLEGRLADLLVERRVKAVFGESSMPTKNVQALLEACAASGHRVALGGELYSDALGPPGTAEAIYVGVVRHNLEAITAALR